MHAERVVQPRLIWEEASACVRRSNAPGNNDGPTTDLLSPACVCPSRLTSRPCPAQRRDHGGTRRSYRNRGCLPPRARSGCWLACARGIHSRCRCCSPCPCGRSRIRHRGRGRARTASCGRRSAGFQASCRWQAWQSPVMVRCSVSAGAWWQLSHCCRTFGAQQRVREGLAALLREPRAAVIGVARHAVLLDQVLVKRALQARLRRDPSDGVALRRAQADVGERMALHAQRGGRTSPGLVAGEAVGADLGVRGDDWPRADHQVRIDEGQRHQRHQICRDDPVQPATLHFQPQNRKVATM